MNDILTPEVFADRLSALTFGTGVLSDQDALVAHDDALRASLAAMTDERDVFRGALIHPEHGMIGYRDCAKCRNPYPEWCVLSGLVCHDCRRAALRVQLAAAREALADAEADARRMAYLDDLVASGEFRDLANSRRGQELFNGSFREWIDAVMVDADAGQGGAL